MMIGFIILAVILCVALGETQELPPRLGYGVNRVGERQHGIHLEHHTRGDHTRGKHEIQGDSSDPTCADVQEFIFRDAVVDNFASAMHQEKWKGSEGQRYWINEKFYAGNNAPIFVYIGGEGTESCHTLAGPKLFMYELAQKHNAMLVDIEHRFYGKSLPTKDVSTKSLTYLSSDQALADLARLITHIKKEYNSKGSRVITFGGSYPGNLAAWFREKYPTVTQGSVASSGPLRAKANFVEYMEVCGEALQYFGGNACYSAFERASNHVAHLAKEGAGSQGMKKIEEDFKVCDGGIRSDLDLATFYSNVMGNVQGTVQYNNERAGVLNVTDICNIMTSPLDSREGSNEDEEAYDHFVALSLKFMEGAQEKCEDVSYEATVKYLADASVPEGFHDKDSNKGFLNAGRSWIYQTCNEFGYYQTTDSKHQPFYGMKELNMDYYNKMCYDLFDGWNTAPNTEFTNTKYGATHIDSTSTVFTAGTIDPWHALGVTNYTQALKEYPSDLPVYILGTAHCEDMHAPASGDSEELTYARKVVAENVAKWLETDSA
jgi:hypothetical protein